MKSLPILVLLLVLAAQPATAAWRIAVVVGNNQPQADDLAPLSFADDDAIQHARLLGYVADEVVLLTRPDEETAILFPGDGGEPPTRDAVLAALDQAVGEAAGRAAAGDTEVVLYFVFSGHGNYDAEGRGYFHLEDGRLTTRDLYYHLLSRSDGFVTVVLVDACNAGFLVRSRGGGERRAAGEPTLELERYPNVGLILSASGQGEVKEWGRYLGGIFSHQVRSGLAGIADVDGDGRITFQELASFIEAANRQVANPALRLTPYIRPPLAHPGVALVDFAAARFPRRLSLAFPEPTRVTVYNADLVRQIEFHLDGGQRTVVALGGESDQVVRVGGETEYRLPAALRGELELDRLESLPADPLAARGVDRYYRDHLFAEPFSHDRAVDYLTGGGYAADLQFERTVELPWYRNGWAWTAVGLGAGLLAGGGSLAWLAGVEREQGEASQWAEERDRANQAIDRYNAWSIATTVAGAGALAAGGALFLWHRPTRTQRVSPEVPPGLNFSLMPGGAMVGGTF